MARTVLAVFESVFSAKLAVYDLLENGLNSDMIDILPRPKGSLDAAAVGPVKKSPRVVTEVDKDAHGVGLQVGLGIGAAIGAAGGVMGLAGALPLALFDTLALNGILSNLIVVFGGASAGAVFCGAFGGLIGGLVGLNIPDEEIRQYARVARREPVMVAILADWDSIDPVIQILSNHNPLELIEKPYSRVDAGKKTLSKPVSELHNGASDRQ